MPCGLTTLHIYTGVSSERENLGFADANERVIVVMTSQICILVLGVGDRLDNRMAVSRPNSRVNDKSCTGMYTRIHATSQHRCSNIRTAK